MQLRLEELISEALIKLREGVEMLCGSYRNKLMISVTFILRTF